MVGGLIAAGVFLAVGIALLIWGLSERSKRSKLALRVVEAVQKHKDVERLLRMQENCSGQLKMDKARLEEQIHALRKTVEGAREQLKASKDPKTVENWLNAEMREQP